MKRLFVLIALVAAAPILRADTTLTMPSARVAAVMNGRLNVILTANDTVTTYTTASDYSALVFEFQTKPVGSETWTAVSGSIYEYSSSNYSTEQNNNSFLYWSAPNSMHTAFELRGRVSLKSDSSVVSDWLSFGTLPAPSDLVGTAVNTKQDNTSGSVNLAHDGYLATFFESYSTTPPWTGLVFTGRPYVKTLRYIPRRTFSTTYSSGEVRPSKIHFEVADDAAFTVNVRTIHTVADTTETRSFDLHEIELAEPVRCAAVRVVTGSAGNSGGCCNFEEVAVQRRPAGTADWTTLATGVSPSGRAFVDETARTKYLYDYRLVASGLNGLMLVPSPTVVTARALPKGVAVMLR